MEYQNLLKDKKIAVAVTGSIAIYKTIELIRLFIKSGAVVRVVMSEDAKKFITPLTFEAISSNIVLHSQTESWANDNNHIGVASWADLFVVAPASANTINKLANGIADNLLLQVAIACNAQKVLAPAANTNMISSPITIASLKMLKLNGYIIADSRVGMLACKVEGKGAMAEPKEIFYICARELLKDEFYTYRPVVITGGGTVEKIDEVRFVSNFSSGKMAEAFVKEAYFKGADVCYVTTKENHDMPLGVHTVKVESAKEMQEMVLESIKEAKKGVMTKPTLLNDSRPSLKQKKPFFFSIAAVSDYGVEFPQNKKIKKESLGEKWNLELRKNPDILKEIEDSEIFKIGFKAEFDKENALESAKKMVVEKKLDAVCLNVLGDEVNFGSNKSKIELITKNSQKNFGFAPKIKIADEILEFLKELEK